MPLEIVKEKNLFELSQHHRTKQQFNILSLKLQHTIGIIYNITRVLKIARTYSLKAISGCLLYFHLGFCGNLLVYR